RVLVSLHSLSSNAVQNILAMMLWPFVGLGTLAAGLIDFVANRDPLSLIDIRTDLTNLSITWKDIVATDHPLTNGALAQKDALLPSSIEIVNRRSMFSDHNGYWRNRDHFVSLVGNELLRLSESTISPASEAMLDDVSGQRGRRVQVLRAVWTITVGAAVIVVIQHAAAWAVLIRWGASKLPALTATGLGLAKVPVPEPEAFATTLGLMVALLIGYGFVRATWDTINDCEMRVVYGDRRRSLPALGFATV